MVHDSKPMVHNAPRLPIATDTCANREEQRFRSAVMHSRAAVEAVARHLQCKGYQVELAPYRMRDSFEERDGFGDDADLYFIRRAGGKVGVEVKGRRFDFTGAHDYPYPTIYVDRVNKVLKSSVTYYVTVNKSLTHLAFVPKASISLWVERKIFDAVKGYPNHVYEAPVDLARFVALQG